VWEGPKPQSGLQAAAREARYRLIGDHLRARATPTLLTAHTLDDQAETLLMRLARGSGLDGLAGIAPAARLGSLLLLRPLLDTPKARLRATLEARHIPWIEDPSNQSPAFERTRLRAAGDALAASASPATCWRSARGGFCVRGRRSTASPTSFCAEPEGAIHTDPCGFFRIDRERLGRAPEEIALRVLARCIAAAGGSDEPVPLGKLEPIVDGLRRGNDPKAASWTLARALITAAPDTVQVEREPGRQPLPHLTLTRGRSALWDGRFAVTAAVDWEGTVEVRALGAEGLAELRRLGRAVRGTRAFQLVPSFWRGSTLIAVPALDFWANPTLRGAFRPTLSAWLQL
jgi:tRNA(Ile)-lysidine synthase